MNYSDRHGLTEEYPLTKDKNHTWKISDCCSGGLKLIVCSFLTLTFTITAILMIQILYTNNKPQDMLGIHGAVATDYTNCSQIGTKILRKGGNAVDAAVAASICMAVVAPHKTGFGGGGYIMIYNHKELSNPLVIDFANNTSEGFLFTLGKRIPAVLKGLEFAQNKFGHLSWYDIVEPSIKLAREGFVVSKELAQEISKHSDYGTLYGNLNAGDLLQLQTLAVTLDIVARFGANEIYNGSLSEKINIHDVNDKSIQEKILTQLANYEPSLNVAQNSTFYQHVIYYPQQAANIHRFLEAVDNLGITAENSSNTASQILVAETLIHISLTAPKEMCNTPHEQYTGVMAMDWQDTYVSILTGLSVPLGLHYMTEAGFLLDEINSENTLCALTPIIFRENAICGLRGIFGADDTVLIVQILYDLIVRSMNLSAAIENQRRTDVSSITKSVNAVLKKRDSMTSHSDSRGGGLASRF